MDGRDKTWCHITTGHQRQVHPGPARLHLVAARALVIERRTSAERIRALSVAERFAESTRLAFGDRQRWMRPVACHPRPGLVLESPKLILRHLARSDGPCSPPRSASRPALDSVGALQTRVLRGLGMPARPCGPPSAAPQRAQPLVDGIRAYRARPWSTSLACRSHWPLETRCPSPCHRKYRRDDQTNHPADCDAARRVVPRHAIRGIP